MSEKRHYDVDKAWQRVDKMATKKQRTRMVNRVGITSLALVLAIFALTPVLKTANENEQFVEEQIVNRNRATLYLAEGTTVELNDSLDNSLEQVIELNKITALNKKAPKNIQKNVLNVPTGGEYYFELPDGTKVWLNSETQLEFPSEFAGNTREITLTGQAYFDVTHNPEKPFIVHTTLGNVEVKGTSFDLKAYKNDRTFETTLVEGLVSVATADKQETTIHPGQRSVYSEEDGKLTTANVDVQLYTSWKDGIFYFENQSLDNITKELERWYEVDFNFENQAAGAVRYTGEYSKNQKLGEILHLLSVTGNVDFRNEGDQILVSTDPS
ncbi:FecR family protein [Maribellus sediminis]|uniref:FecR family protein n=1 Tax=Maribellus sediminis TaxID=2696285 RepID=UPI0014310066|nr:FecR domain-containing protein [Maribellus sediminis]